MNIKDKKPIIILMVTILVLVIGVSLAYFGLTIIGNDTAKKNKIVTGNLELTFTDNDGISLSGVFPGDSITKTITVKNTGSREASYNLVWTELTNEFINDEIIVEATCKNINSSNTEDGTCNSISQKAVSSASNITSNIPVKPGYTQEYTVKITFIDTGKPQNYNKNKSFSGKLGITESSAKTVYCKYDGDLTQGTEYVNGQYTYRYKQEGQSSSSTLGWNNISTDGWGVQLTDKTSTDAVTSELCTYINNKPVVSMSDMFYQSQATTLDLSNFNTSNVIDMSNMFWGSKSTTLNLSSFNTHNIINMEDMFYESKATTINLSNFDTSNVTNMQGMFAESQATTLDLTSFNTSEVIEMKGMFYGSRATTLNLSSFNTSHVEIMEVMFTGTQIETLDLSSFDTSNVWNMNAMFADSGNLKTIYVSDKFNLNNLGDGGGMFTGCTNLVGGAGTAYDENHIDGEYAHIDGGTDNPGYFTDIKYKTSTFSTDSWATIVSSVKNGNNRGYKVGETKKIDMGNYGIHTVRIANTSTPIECRTAGFSQTACGFVLEFADIITNYAMNENGTNTGGWPATTMRTFINNEIYNSLPSELRNAIINTKVVSGHIDSETENYTSTDKLYLLSIPEIWNDWSSLSSTGYYDTASKLTRTLDYYIFKGTTAENSRGAVKESEANDSWSIRTVVSDRFYYINGDGHLTEEHPDFEMGVSPAFRIG